MIINLRVPQKGRNIFTIRTRILFSRRSLLRGFRGSNLLTVTILEELYTLSLNIDMTETTPLISYKGT
jgi:hypothetical protein